MLLVVFLLLVGSRCETTVPPAHRGCEGYLLSRGVLPQDEWWHGGPPRGAPALSAIPVPLYERRTAAPAGRGLGGIPGALALAIASSRLTRPALATTAIISQTHDPVSAACLAVRSSQLRSQALARNRGQYDHTEDKLAACHRPCPRRRSGDLDARAAEAVDSSRRRARGCAERPGPHAGRARPDLRLARRQARRRALDANG